ncbi:MAG: nucleoside phosphorylase [Bacteroidales bacterium]|nr:nucleoside phosphorylase [Bacteroidales bacterium]MBO7469228.1 nucleoside phosphorylase [Bacteroidales bacterium]MBQ3843746.1 nucleoside phosphorylase [Bacteroidales bacterium]
MNTKPIPGSQLVFNNEGAIYHLNLFPEMLADNIILVGDPDRVAMVSQHFDTIEYKRQNRELVTHTGTYKGKRITALSTGMGTDNIDIVVNELDAVANIDFKTRTPKTEHRTLNMVRLGTCGALQPEIGVEDSYVASRYAIGLDGLAYFYKEHNEVINKEMTDAFIRDMKYPTDLPKPYLVESSKELFDRLTAGYHQGITATSPGFYGPQGRSLRLELTYPQINPDIEKFNYNGWKVCNFEMESSALFSLGKMLGHNCLTICVAIANRVTEKFSADYHPYVEKLIENTLERL